MMRSGSVSQLLMALRIMRGQHTPGRPFRKAYNSACRTVARHYRVEPETINDACVRRLNLRSVEEFYALFGEWLQGRSAALESRIKAASEPEAHEAISSFFDPDSANRVDAEQQNAEQQSVLDICLSDQEGRMLRALSELEGEPPNSLARRLLISAVSDRLRVIVA
jgi:hypothetical protein